MDKCPKCGLEFPEYFPECPDCGWKKPPKEKKSMSDKSVKRIWLSLLILVILIPAMKYILDAPKRAEEKKQAAIKIKSEQALRAENARRAADEREKQTKKREQERQAKLLCNSENSAWDGSVRSVEIFLKNNLYDQKSFKAIEWSKIVKLANGECIVQCKYRAKNQFGGYTIKNQIFNLDTQGNVLGAYDYP